LGGDAIDEDKEEDEKKLKEAAQRTHLSNDIDLSLTIVKVCIISRLTLLLTVFYFYLAP
jgi:hypothetical protein